MKYSFWTIGRAFEEPERLNEGQAYTYNRERLIEMLDSAMGAKKD